jgi:hypothetical protein
MAKAKTDKITDEPMDELDIVHETEETPSRLTEEEVITPEVEEKSEKALLEEPKKVTVISDAEVNRIANQRERDLRASWAKEKKVSLIVPFAQGEENIKPTPMAYANINGVEITFPKNQLFLFLPSSFQCCGLLF